AVTMDAAAAGYGWFCGSTAGDTAFGSVVAPKELQAAPGSPALGRMDLLTVVEHELGHVLGLDDLDPQAVPHDLLTTTLAPGVRRLPTPVVEVVAPAALATPEASPAPSTLQTPAAPLVVPPVAPAGGGADPLGLTLAADAEAPAGPLVVTAAAAVAAPALDGSLPAGDGARRSSGADGVAQALGGLLLADLAKPLPVTSAL